jgi:hypothetical protein
MLFLRGFGSSPSESARSHRQPGIVIKAEQFKDNTTAPNQLWQTDFTYLKIMGWAGTTSRPCWTTSRASLSPGSSVRT